MNKIGQILEEPSEEEVTEKKTKKKSKKQKKTRDEGGHEEGARSVIGRFGHESCQKNGSRYRVRVLRGYPRAADRPSGRY